MSDWKLISEATASDAASVEFTDLSGFKIFKFVFIDVQPVTDSKPLAFQVNASDDVGGDFDESYITSTFFDADHTEGDIASGPQYETGDDQAQGTSYQRITRGVGNESDECFSGELFLFNPTSTTYVKHFYSRTAEYMSSPRILDNFVGGYINQTLALSEISLKFDSGNINAGTIKQYGLVAT